MKNKFNDLIRKGGLMKEGKIGKDQAKRFLSRARKDLKTARKILSSDEAVALDLVYKSMFHAANALIRSFGLRPGRTGQHKAVIQACEKILDKPANVYILRFDKLRQKRNYFEYGAGFLSSRTEIKNSLIEAEKFIEIIEKHLSRVNPQLGFF
jgi:uncharacterized protein (UPF0332 family)